MKITLRRCSWHPGGKMVFTPFRDTWGQRINLLVGKCLPKLFIFTDGACAECEKRLNAEIDAMLRNAGRH